MSKKLKLAIIIVSTGVLGLLIERLLGPNKAELVPTEVNIQQTSMETVENKVHEDFAGFRFEYPGELIIEEVELNDERVYSSLELKGPKNKQISLRISDTEYEDVEQWQEMFEVKNVAGTMKEIAWTDMTGLQLSYGAPAKLMSVAVDQQILYRLESPADEGGYWDKAHQTILNSFEFTETVTEAEVEPKDQAETESQEIILLEEQVIE